MDTQRPTLPRWWWRLDAGPKREPPIDPATGFLRDTSHAQTLEALADVHCLVLLGDAGSGKTTAVEAAARALETQGARVWVYDCAGADVDSVSVWLKEAIDTGRRGTPAHLFLDGLDEMATRVHGFTQAILNALADLDGLRNLRLRIVSRGAALPEDLPRRLEGRFGPERMAVYTLLPLREEDVTAALSVLKLPEDERRSVIAKHAPLLARAQLLDLLSRDRDMLANSQTSWELFDDMLGVLVQAPGVPDEFVSSRRHIAGVLAAGMLLAGKQRLQEQGPATARRPEVLRLASFGDVVPLAEASSLLRTAQVFKIEHETRTAAFAHRRYAEHLAAEFLAAHPSPDAVVEALMPDGDVSPRVIPSLRGLAALLATRRRYFRRLVARDPLTLLEVDPYFVDAAQRAELVEAVLSHVETLRAQVWWYDIGERLAAFSHPDFAAQLLGWITREDCPEYTRVVAIGAAIHGKATSIAAELSALACNEATAPRVRGRAARAVLLLGERTVFPALCPLVTIEARADADEEEIQAVEDLKAVALEALWPDTLDAPTLFAVLHPPRSDGYIGPYRMFAEVKLPQRLTPASIPEALRWLERQSGQRLFWPPDGLRVAILARAVEHLDAPQIAECLAAYMATAPRKDDRAGGTLQHALAQLAEPLRARRRWALLDLLVPLCSTDADGSSLWFRLLPLVSADDASALLDRADASVTPQDTLAWVQLATTTQQQAAVWNGDVADRLLRYVDAPESPTRSWLSWLWKPVSLDDEHIRWERERIVEQRRAESQRTQAAQQLHGFIDDLKRRVMGGELDAFWQLILAVNRRVLADGLVEQWWQHPLVGSEAWQAWSTEERGILLDRALEYLQRRTVEGVVWSRQASIPWSVLAGRHALVALAMADERRLDALDAAHWRTWMPLLLVPDWTPAEASPELTRSLLERARAADAPALRDVALAAYRASPDGDPRLIEALVPVLDLPLVDALLPLLRANETTWQTLDRVLPVFGAHEEPTIRQRAAQLAEEECREEEGQRPERFDRIATAMAWRLRTQAEASWPALLPRFEANPTLGMAAVQRAEQRSPTGWSPPFASAEALRRFYVWGRRAFLGSADVPRPAGRLHATTPRDTLQWLLPNVFARLVALGTREALNALESLQGEFPDDASIPAAMHLAREHYLDQTWRGRSVPEVVAMLHGQGARGDGVLDSRSR